VLGDPTAIKPLCLFGFKNRAPDDKDAVTAEWNLKVDAGFKIQES